MAKVIGYRIISHTGDDDKDRDNAVICRLSLGAVTIFSHPGWHKELVFRNGDDNAWAPEIKSGFDTTQAGNAQFFVSMTGDDGDWISAFSLIGLLEDGTEYRLLSRTRYVKFRDGKNDEFVLPLTAVSGRVRRD